MDLDLQWNQCGSPTLLFRQLARFGLNNVQRQDFFILVVRITVSRTLVVLYKSFKLNLMQDELSEFRISNRVHGSEFRIRSGSRKAKKLESGFSEPGPEMLVITSAYWASVAESSRTRIKNKLTRSQLALILNSFRKSITQGRLHEREWRNQSRTCLMSQSQDTSCSQGMDSWYWYWYRWPINLKSENGFYILKNTVQKLLTDLDLTSQPGKDGNMVNPT